MAPEVHAPVSVEAFWRFAGRLPRAELVAGQVIELAPPGTRHGVVTAAIARRLTDHVSTSRSGIVTVDAGFVLSVDPPTVRGPDVAVVLNPRVPSPLPEAFFPGPPDLAVEVLSPDDRPGEIAAKVAEYLRAGTQAVWVIDPARRTLTVHTARAVTLYREHETVPGEPLLPQFTLALDQLF